MRCRFGRGLDIHFGDLTFETFFHQEKKIAVSTNKEKEAAFVKLYDNTYYYLKIA